MDAKLKANELVSKFSSVTPLWLSKDIAIFCVDEILKCIYEEFEDNPGHLVDEEDAASYWKEVKIEIQNSS